MEIHTLNGAAGVRLHVRDYGKSSGVPILLIHGWSQSHLCWAKQFGSALKDEAMRKVTVDAFTSEASIALAPPLEPTESAETESPVASFVAGEESSPVPKSSVIAVDPNWARKRTAKLKKANHKE
jgi:hypothetical protein